MLLFPLIDIARIFCDVYLGWFNWVQFLAYFCSSLSPVKVTAGQSCWLRLKARVGAIKAFQGRGGTLRCCKCDHISTLYQLQPTEINFSGAGMVFGRSPSVLDTLFLRVIGKTLKSRIGKTLWLYSVDKRGVDIIRRKFPQYLKKKPLLTGGFKL